MILEDIALDATVDDQERLIADTTVRQIADHLGINKSTVARHLAWLRDHGFVLHEETHDEASGRWDTSSYVLDPSACVERFTHTPPAEPPPWPPSPALDDPVDSTDATVSAFTRHGATGHGETDQLLVHRHAVEEEQHAKHPGDDETAAALIRRLRTAGVAANVAEDLVARYRARQIRDALDVLPARRCSNAAGWLVRAISDGWQLHDEAERLRTARTRSQQRHDDAQATEARQEQRDRTLAGWAAAVSEALTDTQLTTAVDRVTRPVDGLDCRSVPVAASQLLAWAITTATSAPDKPLYDALTDALHDHSTHRTDGSSTLPAEIPRPPATPDAASDPDAFRRRVKHAIDHLETANLTREPKLEGDSDAP